MKKFDVVTRASSQLWLLDVAVIGLVGLGIALELDAFDWPYTMIALAIYMLVRGILLVRTSRWRRHLLGVSAATVGTVVCTLCVARSCNEWLIVRRIDEYRRLAERCRADARLGDCRISRQEEELVEYALLERESDGESVRISPRGRKGILVYVPSGVSAERVKQERCVAEVRPGWFLLRRC